MDSKTICFLVEFPETDCKPELIMIRGKFYDTWEVRRKVEEVMDDMNELSYCDRLDSLDAFLDSLRALFGDRLEVHPVTEIIEIK